MPNHNSLLRYLLDNIYLKLLISLDCSFVVTFWFCIHVSSPITALSKKFCPFLLIALQKSKAVPICWDLCLSASIFSTIHAVGLQYHTITLKFEKKEHLWNHESMHSTSFTSSVTTYFLDYLDYPPHDFVYRHHSNLPWTLLIWQWILATVCLLMRKKQITNEPFTLGRCFVMFEIIFTHMLEWNGRSLPNMYGRGNPLHICCIISIAVSHVKVEKNTKITYH